MALQADQDFAYRFRPDEYPGAELIKSKDEAQIRLLEVLPGIGDDAVRCNLRCVHFNAIKEADALSYTWGLPPASNTIFVNDAPFRVRKNLFEALIHLRQPSSGTVLWIDAICINQSDIEERNHQVQQMADIFSRARKVVVWLGLETETTQEVFSFLSDAYLRSPFNRKELMDDPRWAALKQICEVGYWKRVWIVQEICLASRVVICCGRQKVPWQYISELRKARKHIWSQYYSAGERDFMRSLPARLDQQKESRLKGGCILWTLLENFRNSLCQEVHDKIYGFIGLSTDCGSQGLAIDYAKSVDQIYRDVIWFYHEKFQGDSSSHHAAQLMKLSEFLQTLLGIHSRSDEDVQEATPDQQPLYILQRQLGESRPVRSTFVSISACNLITIVSFPSSDDAKAKAYRVSELVDFLQGRIPYSHLGYWRDLVKSDLNGVNTINDSQAYATAKYTDKDRPPPTQKINRPSVFIAVHINNGSADYSQPYVVGIAPAGSQTGDLVLSFVESQFSLVMRDPTPSNAITPRLGRKFEDPKYKLIGRGCVFFSHMQTTLHYRSQLMADKTVEIVKLASPGEPVAPGETFPATLSIDLLTLQIVTRSNTNYLASGFDKPTLELFPSESSKLHLKDRYAHRLQKAVDDSELRKMQESPEAKRYAFGPGYTAIINPGAIGYVVSALQILYMLKPFRTAVLCAENSPDQQLLNELQKLFWKLHNSYLPVDPLGLTKAIGWGVREINQPHDFFEFWRKFTSKVEGTTLGQESTAFTRGKMRSDNKELGMMKCDDYFDDMSIHVGPDLNRLEDGLDDYFFGFPGNLGYTMTIMQPPQVCILHAQFMKHDVKADRMANYSGTFEYPSEVDLAKYSDPSVTDTVYQLHGVVVLEDVKPIPRYLLFLRPRLEEQWILFFKETVSYAQLSEVFEDNFRLDNETTRNAPLRTPFFFVYIQKSKLDQFLG